jgi:two-component system NtrC family sensor kinase
MLDQTEYSRRILVIDDNEAIHADFRKVLLEKDEDLELKELERLCFGESEVQDATIDLKFEVSHAHQGEAGVQMVSEAMFNEVPFDMAFVDMRMPPGWNGIRTIQELWKVDPDLEIVICSAYSDHTWTQITEELGRSHQLLILKKPFDTTEVLQMSLALTEKRRLNRIASLKMEQIALIVVERTEELRQQKMEVDATLLDLMSLLECSSPDGSTLERFVV